MGLGVLQESIVWDLENDDVSGESACWSNMFLRAPLPVGNSGARVGKCVAGGLGPRYFSGAQGWENPSDPGFCVREVILGILVCNTLAHNFTSTRT